MQNRKTVAVAHRHLATLRFHFLVTIKSILSTQVGLCSAIMVHLSDYLNLPHLHGLTFPVFFNGNSTENRQVTKKTENWQRCDQVYRVLSIQPSSFSLWWGKNINAMNQKKCFLQCISQSNSGTSAEYLEQQEKPATYITSLLAETKAQQMTSSSKYRH